MGTSEEHWRPFHRGKKNKKTTSVVSPGCQRASIGQHVHSTPAIALGPFTETVCVCQATAMLWASPSSVKSRSLGAVDRPLGPAGTQGPICSTECVILSQQACHSSNHSNAHSFLEFLDPGASEDNQGAVYLFGFGGGLVSLIHGHCGLRSSGRHPWRQAVREVDFGF